MPPRYGKSTYVSVAFPAFVLGVDPTRRLIVVSHSGALAAKLSNDFRQILSAPWYKRIFPDTRVSRKKNTESEVLTTRGGGRLAVSLAGSLTGRGAHFLIFDDPLNAADAYADSKRERVNELVRSAQTRLDDKATGGLILAMQRLHADDPCGNVLSEPANNWRTLSLPAIAEEDAEIQIGEEGSITGAPVKLCTPTASLFPFSTTSGSNRFGKLRSSVSTEFLSHWDGLIFRRSWVKRFDQPPIRTATSIVIQSWDTAIKSGERNDYAACVTVMLDDKKFHVIDVFRGRPEYPDLIKLAKSQAAKHRPTRILVETRDRGLRLCKNSSAPASPLSPSRPNGIRPAA